MTRVAQFAVRRPKLVIGCWLVLVLGLGVVGRGVEEEVKPTDLLVPGTEAARWNDLRKGHFGEDAMVLLQGPREEIDRQGPRVARALSLRPGTRALSPWTKGSEASRLRPSPDRAVIVLDLEVPEGQTQSTIVAPLERFIHARVSPPVESHLAGSAPLSKDLNEATTEGAHKAELLAAPVLVIVLLLIFRTPLAAAIPLLMGQGTVFASFGVISIFLARVDLDAIALSMASGIGLALGVDYSLLIISRFREALDDGLPPRQAASLAANTAGRTAVFAGSVLTGIMLVALLLSPGTVLLSSAVGVVASTALSMLGAALVTPAAIRLAGHRVNKWRLGGSRQGGLSLGRIVGRASRRPGMAAAVVLALLMLLASPVAAMKLIPPDPRQLPEDSQGRKDLRLVREAGFGPTVEVAIRAPRGAIMDPSRLAKIEPFERRLEGLRFVQSVFGPRALADRTEDVRKAPRTLRSARRQLKGGERDLDRLAGALLDATDGVHQLRDGLALASSGSGLLASGTGDARDGAQELAAGNRQAQGGAAELTSGTGRARQGSEQLAAGSRQLSDGLNAQLAPGANRLARELRAGQQQLQALSLPVQAAERELRNAFDSLNRMGAGKTDPLFAQALARVSAALAAVTNVDPLTGRSVFGDYKGLTASVSEAADGAGQAADGAATLAGGASDAAGGAGRLSSGADELAQGLRRLEDGNARLETGLDRLADGSPVLAAGLERLRAGQSELAGSLASAYGRSAPLEEGLGEAHGQVSDTHDQLLNRAGPFESLRSLDDLERQSPGLFESGYVAVAALNGAPALDRDAATFIADSERGAQVGRISVLPDVPMNDPRTEGVVDKVTAATRDFERASGLEAAVGGNAGKLVEYDRVTSGRLPLLIGTICLVTYLLLVPILRSLVLPAIAVALNMATVAGSFGVLSLLFVGDDPPLGGAGALDVLSVASVFTLTFALSIDYQVFLLTRMREEFVRTQSNDAAIEFGIDRTAKVVTGAAAIMVAVFLAFAASDFVILKQFGVGLATAVLIDATIVRLALLPAVMRLFGLSTWWLPEWLDQRLPVLDVEGSELAHEWSRPEGSARAGAGGQPPLEAAT